MSFFPRSRPAEAGGLRRLLFWRRAKPEAGEAPPALEAAAADEATSEAASPLVAPTELLACPDQRKSEEVSWTLQLTSRSLAR